MESLKCFIFITHLFASSLVDSSWPNEMSWGLYPIKIWLGKHLVVEFSRPLWTAVVMGSQTLHLVGLFIATMWRYCPIHWFFHSVRPSICGWNAVDRFCCVPIFLARALLKWEVNQGSLLLITLFGSLYHGKMCSRYIRAMSDPVIPEVHGKNTAALEHSWSTIVRIASCPLLGGSPIIRSIAIVWNGKVPIFVGIWYGGVSLGVC